MREAPTYSFPTSLKPHLPSSSSSSEFVSGFGLPINFFTKNFFKEAAHSKGIHQGLLDKILDHSKKMRKSRLGTIVSSGKLVNPSGASNLTSRTPEN
jgi:hypothetical protein